MNPFGRLGASFAALLLGCASLAPCPAARAEGPTAADVPTLEQVLAKAAEAKAARERAAAEAARDPHREAINAYREGTSDIGAWEPLTDLVLNSKDEEMAVYRRAAAMALVKRFEKADQNDPDVKKMRCEIGLELVDLMKANSRRDSLGIGVVYAVLQKWWPRQVRDFNFAPSKSAKDRNDAYKKMKKYLRAAAK